MESWILQLIKETKETAEPTKPVQGSAEWLEKRRGLFTASEAYKLIGKEGNQTALTYCYQRAAERLGHYIPSSSSAAMNWGNELEKEAIKWYSEKENTIVQAVSFEKHKMLPVGCSLDGLVFDGFIEVKCPYMPENVLKLIDYIRDLKVFKVKKKDYFWQVVCSFLVYPNLEYCDYVVYSGQLNKGFCKRIERSEVSEEILILEEQVLNYESVVQDIVERNKDIFL